MAEQYKAKEYKLMEPLTDLEMPKDYYTGPKNVDYTGQGVQTGDMTKLSQEYFNRPEDQGNRKDLWESVSTPVHALLGGLGMASGIGEPVGIGADILDTALYWLEGDKTGAGLSAAAIIPGVGLASGTTKLGRLVRKKKKLTETVEDMGEFSLNKKITRSDGSYNVISKSPNEINRVVNNMVNMDPEKLLTDDNIGLIGRSSPLMKKFLDAKYSRINDDIYSEAQELLKKELLSDDSYTNWVKMRKKAYNIRRSENLDGFSLGHVERPNISRAYYNREVIKTIDETKGYVGPRSEVAKLADVAKDSKGSFGGVFNRNLGDGTIMMPDDINFMNTIRGRTSLVHELKHSVQNRWRGDLNLAYGDMLRDLNRKKRSVIRTKRDKMMFPDYVVPPVKKF